jgi:hypothetical protein
VIGVVASLTAITLLFLAVFILFFDYPDYLRKWIEGEATRVLGAPVTIDSISVDLPNYGFVIAGVRVEARTDGPAPLEIESVRGQLNLTRVFDRGLHLALLEVSGLKFRVQDYGGGQIEVPGRLRAPGRPANSAAGGMALLADRIRIENALFVYNNTNIPWRLEAQELAANLEREGSSQLRGTIGYERGSVRVKGRQPIEAALDARFRLSGRELEVEELIVRGTFYELLSKGNIILGAEPQAELVVHVESEVGPAAKRLLGLTLLSSGRGNRKGIFEGVLLMGRGWHLLRGVARIPEARFAGMPLRDFEGNVLWDRNVVELQSVEGVLAGGTASFNFRQPTPITSGPAELDLKFEDVRLSQVMESTGNDLGFASRVSGGANVSFPLTDLSLASGDFELVGVAPDEPDKSDESELPGLDFSVGGVLEGGELELRPSRFETDGVVATLAGSYPRTAPASLSFEAVAQDLARVDRLQKGLRALMNPARPPRLLEIAGSGRAKGRLEGRLPGLTFKGAFSGRDVTYHGIRWGDVEAEGSLSAETVHFDSFKAKAGDAALGGSGALALGPGSLAESTRDFDVAVELSGWPASSLEILFGIPLDLQGRLTGKGRFTTEGGERSGEARATLEEGSVEGQVFDRASSRIRLRGREVLLDDLSISQGAAELAGTLRIHTETREVEGKLQGRRIPVSGLAGLAELGPAASRFEGELNGSVIVGGTLTQPDIEVQATVSGLVFAETRLGSGRLETRLRDETLRGSLTLTGEALELETDVQVRITPGFPFEGRARFRGVDVAPLLRSVRDGLPDSLRLISNGEASFEGRLDSIETFSAEGRLSSLTTVVSNYRLDSSAPVELKLQMGRLELKTMELVGDQTRLSVSGTVALDGTELDLDAEGSVNLQVLGSFFPSTTWSGEAEVAASLVGRWEHPSISGHVDLNHGALSIREFPHAFGDIQGRILFDNRTVRLQGVEARFGGAPVSLTGSFSLSGLRPDSFELRGTGNGLRLRYPQGLVATVDADLSLTGTASGQILAGRIDVQEATWTREYDVAAGILGTRGDIELVEPSVDETFPDLRLDVSVVAPDGLKVRNSLATIDGGAEFQLRGTFDRPALLGRAEAVRGKVFLLGQRYNIVSLKVEFVDPTSIKPFFDLAAESRVRSYQVQLRIAGTPERFFPELSSDPPLRPIEILRLLAGATESELRTVGSEEEELASVTVAGLLTERLNQQLSRRAERLFGLDRISVDPALVGRFANPVARVSVGKQISRDLAINYSTAFGETTESIVVVIEYTPKGPVSWILSRDETGALAVDMKFRKSF